MQPQRIALPREVIDRQQRVDALLDEMTIVNARIAGAEYRFLCMVRQLEEIIDLQGEPFSQYMCWRFQMSRSTAYEHIRVARALAELPAISKLFEEGRVTYSKVRIVTRIATPETDAEYANLALHGPVHFLENVVGIHDTILPSETQRQESRRYLNISTDDDGMVIVRARLTPDEGAIFKKAIDAAKTGGAENATTALTHVAKAAVEKLATGDDAVLHVECSDHICAVEGHACSRATAERLICQNPHRRKASSSQVRALKRIQGGCCGYPRCTNRHWLDAHHIVFWENGGKTVLSNLILLCDEHHRTIHEGGHSLTIENGERVFRNQHGYVIPQVPPQPSLPRETFRLADITTPNARDLHPGEFFTTRENLEASIDGLLNASRAANTDH